MLKDTSLPQHIPGLFERPEIRERLSRLGPSLSSSAKQTPNPAPLEP